MKYKLILLFFISYFSLMASVYAGSSYSFSGLNWNDSISIVNEKLKSAGNSGLSTLEKSKCLTLQFGNSECICKFNGPGLNWAYVTFKKGKLTDVILSADDAENTLKVLTKKYGKPHTLVDPNYRGGLKLIEDTKRWVSSTGEMLEMNGKVVHYYSNYELHSNNEERKKEDSRF
ncbi:MAG: hypothetical protein CTY27_04050 [Methylotenera sp.]|nr:MAG: hypothetical protein CTY27_04050 [Methylotenera sp.]